jgi:hypothetical protein
MVRPDNVTTVPGMMWKTRLALLPLITPCGPGPLIVTFLLTISSPLVSVIVLLATTLMVSPLAADASAARNEPGPLSAVLWTVIVRALTLAAVQMRRIETTALVLRFIEHLPVVVALRGSRSTVLGDGSLASPALRGNALAMPSPEPRCS